MRLTSDRILVCALLALFTLVAKATAEDPDPLACPSESSQQPFTGFLSPWSTRTHELTSGFEMKPCETLQVQMSGSYVIPPLIGCNSGSPSTASMTMKLFNASMQELARRDFICNAGSCSQEIPAPNTAPGYPLPGTRGPGGLAKYIQISAQTFNWCAQPPVNYTLIASKQPRPSYNIGGTNYGNAPLIPLRVRHYGSVHPLETEGNPIYGQYYKIQLQPGQTIYLTGQARGTPWAAAFTVTLFNENLQSLQLLVNMLADQTTRPLTPEGTAPATYTHTGPSPAYYYLRARSQAYPTVDFQFEVQDQLPTVTITEANIVTDEVKITLSPESLSGTLTITSQGTSPTGSPFNHTIFTGTKPSGNHTFSFNRQTLPLGQHTNIQAKWRPFGTDVTDNEPVSFLVMGDYRHSQYNTPYESQCVGPPDPAYITDTQCLFTSTNLRSDFIGQSWLNGSGVTINYGIEQNEAWCLTHGTPPPDANGRSFRPGAIVPFCGAGYVVSNSTVAKGDDAPLVCGDQVLIVGLGGPNAAVTKSVTDRCPACTGHLQLDNYTTQQACQRGAIPDLGTFRTIRLR